VLALLVEALGDAKSWLGAVADDLRWMALCLPEYTFTMHSWIEICRVMPKKARNIVRVVCDSTGARSVTLAENLPNIRKLTATCSCWCGKAFTSHSAFAVHAFKAHGRIPPASLYAWGHSMCHCCLLQFGTRDALIKHLSNGRNGANICLLNCVVRIPPLSRDDDKVARQAAQVLKLKLVHSGFNQYKRDDVVFRVPGPLNRIIDMDGSWVSPWDKRHPQGPGRRLFITSEFIAPDFVAAESVHE
jgi:hypothetical protein